MDSKAKKIYFHEVVPEKAEASRDKATTTPWGPNISASRQGAISALLWLFNRDARAVGSRWFRLSPPTAAGAD